jgi:hypothetical protein
MKARTMRNIIRRTRSYADFQELRLRFSRQWAGDHKGRLRVVRMLDETQARLDQAREEIRRKARDG